jgi:diaminopimelate decarboxylase
MDDAQLLDIAGRYGTPVYAYDGDYIRNQCVTFRDSFKNFPSKVKCCYAIKANTNLAILKIIRKEGFGADVVSQGELDAAIKSGFKPQDIVYTSNSKSRADIEAAVKAGVNLTVGNTHEITLVKESGGEKIAFRVNPDVDAKTHPKISTSLMGSKFGLHFEGDIAFDAAKKALDAGLKVSGIHCHIGSNVKQMDAFMDAAKKMFSFAQRLSDELGIKLEFIDLGGGLGVRYDDEEIVSVQEFASSYLPIVEGGVGALGYSPDIWFEPGRYIVAESGILLSRVNSIKETPAATFINLDTGFNHLMRTALYDAYHNIRAVGKKGTKKKYHVAGNLCESGDLFGKDRPIASDIQAGDIIAIENAGAYGYSMSSNYNSVPQTPEILVRGGMADLIRERQDIQELYVRQRIPKDLM